MSSPSPGQGKARTKTDEDDHAAEDEPTAAAAPAPEAGAGNDAHAVDQVTSALAAASLAPLATPAQQPKSRKKPSKAAALAEEPAIGEPSDAGAATQRRASAAPPSQAKKGKARTKKAGADDAAIAGPSDAASQPSLTKKDKAKPRNANADHAADDEPTAAAAPMARALKKKRKPAAAAKLIPLEVPGINLPGGFFAGNKCSTKVPLATHPIRIAMDCSPNSKAKHHSGLPSPEEFVKFAKWFRKTPNRLRGEHQPSCLYEVIEHEHGTPTRLGFDLERKFHPAELEGGQDALAAARSKSISAFMRYLQDLLRTLSCSAAPRLHGSSQAEPHEHGAAEQEPRLHSAALAQHLQLTPGINCQLCESVYPHKVSCHAVFYLSTPCCWDLCSQVAHLLKVTIMSLPSGHADRDLLIGPEGKCFVDTDAYGNFRLMRLVYNCKFEDPSPLLPILGSSKRTEDHLCCFYPELQLPTAEPFPLDSAAIAEAYARLPAMAAAAKPTASFSSIRVTPGKPRTHAATSWQAAELDAVMDHLRTNAELAALLRVPAVQLAQQYPSKDGKRCFIHLDPGCKSVCPFSADQHAECRAHKKNHMYISYHHAQQQCTLRCHNGNCKERLHSGKAPTIRWDVTLTDPVRTIAAAMDAKNATNLHSRHAVITWTQDYCRDDGKMDAFLEALLLIIRAGMGTGKTEQLIEHIRKLLELAAASGEVLRVLVVTFRRSLAYKLSSDLSTKMLEALEALGEEFKNYLELDIQETDGCYDANLLVVQADSLPKVKPESYHLVVLDECASSIQHLAGATIKDHTSVIVQLERFMCTARQVILMDATADDMPTHGFVQVLERLMGTRATWINNRYVRPTDKGVQVHLCDTSDPEQRNAFRSLHLKCVFDLLLAGKRVCAPVSTATQAKVLKKKLDDVNKQRAAAVPPQPPIKGMVIIGSSEESQKRELYTDFQGVLQELDFFAFSPSVTAGPSFEAEHFDFVVQLAENAADYGCTVDAVMQMFKRIRQVGPKDVPGGPTAVHHHFFVLDKYEHKMNAGPIAEDGLDRHIEKNMNMVRKYVAPALVLAASSTVDGDSIGSPGGSASSFLELDKSSLAYACLRARMYMLHKSMGNYHAIVVNTLREYGMAVMDRYYARGGAWYRKGDPELREVERLRGQVVADEEGMAKQLMQQARESGGVVGENVYRALRRRQGGGADVIELAPLEQQQLREYRMAIVWYGMPHGAVDEAFIETYVGSYVPPADAMAKDLLFVQLSRLEVAQSSSVAQLRAAYVEEQQLLMYGGGDATAGYTEPLAPGAGRGPECLLGKDADLGSNTEVSRVLSDKHAFYQVAIQMCRLLDLLSAEWRAEVVGGMSVESHQLKTAMEEWARGFTDDGGITAAEEYAGMLKLMRVHIRSGQPGATLEDLRAKLSVAEGKGAASTATRLLKKLLKYGVAAEVKMEDGEGTIKFPLFNAWQMKRKQQYVFHPDSDIDL